VCNVYSDFHNGSISIFVNSVLDSFQQWEKTRIWFTRIFWQPKSVLSKES